jgi:hypothetical protein
MAAWPDPADASGTPGPLIIVVGSPSDERVGKAAPSRSDHAGENSGFAWCTIPLGGTTGKLLSALSPAEERVALLVSGKLELGVQLKRIGLSEVVDLHGVVDDELDREERVDLSRVAAEVVHGVAHCGEVDHGRDAGEGLQEHAARRERDLL